MEKLTSWNGLISSLLIMVIISIGYIQPGYNSISQTISELASPGQPYADIVRILFFSSGITFLLFSVYLKGISSARSKWVWMSMVMIGMCSIIGSIFSIDKVNLLSTSSIIHSLAGLLLMIFSIVGYMSTFRIQKAKGKRTSSLLIIGTLGWVGIMITIFYQSYTGAGQRIFYLGLISLLVYQTLYLGINNKK